LAGHNTKQWRNILAGIRGINQAQRANFNFQIRFWVL
jgi:hypothetical protein